MVRCFLDAFVFQRDAFVFQCFSMLLDAFVFQCFSMLLDAFVFQRDTMGYFHGRSQEGRIGHLAPGIGLKTKIYRKI